VGFKLKAADGTYITVPDGEYYFNTKARGRRMMLNSLSSDARRVYACLELATMGFQQELAVTMERGEQRPLTPTHIRQQTGLLKQNVTRGLVELEDAGLAKREADDKGLLRNGHIQIYSWAVPREPKSKKVIARDYLPAWFPESWAPLKPLISRFKYSLIEDEGVARDYFEEGAEAARDYQRAEEVAARVLEKVRAGRKGARPTLYVERTERTPPPLTPPPAVPSLPAKAEEEEPAPTFATFKALYPQHRFDEGKTKSIFEGMKPDEQAKVVAQLRVYLQCPRWVMSLEENQGKWIPLSSTWIKTYDADPPPLLRKHDAANEKLRKQAESIEQTVKFARMFRGGQP
jgi:hypothetical protein